MALRDRDNESSSVDHLALWGQIKNERNECAAAKWHSIYETVQTTSELLSSVEQITAPEHGPVYDVQDFGRDQTKNTHCSVPYIY